MAVSEPWILLLRMYLVKNFCCLFISKIVMVPVGRGGVGFNNVVFSSKIWFLVKNLVFGQK